MQFLIQCDFLVQPYQFKSQNGENKKTLIGGILSIFLIISSIVYFAAAFIQKLQKNQVIYASSYGDNINDLVLTDNVIDFFLNIHFENQNFMNLNQTNKYYHSFHIFLDTQIYKLHMQKQERLQDNDKNNIQKKTYSFQTKQCSPTYLEKFKLDPLIFPNKLQQKLICLNHSDNYQILGDFYSKKFNYLEISVVKCLNSTNYQCETDNNINQIIDAGIEIDLFILESQVKRQLNRTDPGSRRLLNVYWKLNQNLATFEDIYLTSISIDESNILLAQFLKNPIHSLITLIHFLLSDINSKNIYKGVKLKSRERRTGETENEYLMKSYLRLHKDQEYYFIIEDNIGAQILIVISQVSGLMIALKSFLSFLYKEYSQHKLFESLMNSIFFFDFLQKDQKNNQDDKSEQEKKKQHLRRLLDQQIEYPYWRYLIFCIQRFFFTYFRCCCRKLATQVQDDKLLIVSQMAKRKIEVDLDFQSILKRLYEIDCIKLFLFDDDQLLLFNSFSTPVIQDKKLMSHVYQRQNAKIQRTQTRKSNQMKMSFLLQAEISITDKLTKFATFFKAQYEEKQADILVQSYEKIINNSNTNKMRNQQIIKFLKLNPKLFQVIQEYSNGKKENLSLENMLRNSNSELQNSIDEFGLLQKSQSAKSSKSQQKQFKSIQSMKSMIE